MNAKDLIKEIFEKLEVETLVIRDSEYKFNYICDRILNYGKTGYTLNEICSLIDGNEIVGITGKYEYSHLCIITVKGNFSEEEVKERNIEL